MAIVTRLSMGDVLLLSNRRHTVKWFLGLCSSHRICSSTHPTSPGTSG